MSTKPFSILSAGHTGFTVTSLDDSLAFWHKLLNLPILYRREMDLGPLPNAVGIPHAKIETALLSLPGGHQVELLEYKCPEDRATLLPRPCDVGNVHLAVNVKGAAVLTVEAKRLGWEPAVEEPVTLKRGDGSVWAIAYLRSPDGVTVELMEEVEG